jgi:hypothetical protein
MPKPHTIALALVVGSVMGCAHTSRPGAPAVPEAPAQTAALAPDPAPEIDEPPAPETLEVPPGATVVEMEPEDLGGGATAVIAQPRRPALGSMLDGVGMAPSR